MANFGPYTRYINGTVATNRSNKEFLTLRPKLNLEPADGDVFVPVTQDIILRPDLISFKAYGTPELWWAIYEYNGIKDPLFDLKINQTIRIPDINRLLAALENVD